MQYNGNLRKMQVIHTEPVSYSLRVGEHNIDLNSHIGNTIRILFSGLINCVECGRRTNKSFNQGYCFPCFKSKASCDRCIMSPELCHYDQGTCREPEWGESNCMTPHIVYLANSSGIKVGITRETQVPIRWMDQGAVQALPVLRVRTRFDSGKVEKLMKAHMSDRTNWRKMLKNEVEDIDLAAFWKDFCQRESFDSEHLAQDHEISGVEFIDTSDHLVFDYPVDIYPEKIKSLNPEKTPEISGVLQGIKGQYLILDSGVINLRKFGGYHVEVILS